MPLRSISGYEPIGAKDRWIQFLAPGVPPSDGGPSIPTVVVETWASIRGVRADERDQVAQIAQKVSHVAIISWQPNLQESMQIGYLDRGQKRTFQIVGILDADEHRVDLKIFCFEMGQNSGGSA